MASIKALKDSKALAVLCAKLALEKKAKDLSILNIEAIDGAPADWFVIASCASEPQLRTTAESIVASAKKAGIDAPRSEGWDSMNWIIIDFFDVVVHVMKEEAREYYKLEKLWSDAEFFNVSASGRLTKSSPKSTLKSAVSADGGDGTTTTKSSKTEKTSVTTKAAKVAKVAKAAKSSTDTIATKSKSTKTPKSSATVKVAKTTKTTKSKADKDSE